MSTLPVSFDEIVSQPLDPAAAWQRVFYASLAELYAMDHGPSFVIISNARTEESHYSWTEDAEGLADGLDRAAMADGWHGFDYLALCDRHCLMSERGQLTIRVYPVRTLWRDLDAKRRATKKETGDFLVRHGRPRKAAPEKLARAPWLGFGPLLRRAYEATR